MLIEPSLGSRASPTAVDDFEVVAWILQLRSERVEVEWGRKGWIGRSVVIVEGSEIEWQMDAIKAEAEAEAEISSLFQTKAWRNDTIGLNTLSPNFEIAPI